MFDFQEKVSCFNRGIAGTVDKEDITGEIGDWFESGEGGGIGCFVGWLKTGKKYGSRV